MQQDTESTKVVFLKWKDDGEIIALFPELNHTNNCANFGNIMSYMHIGQHDEAPIGLLNDPRLKAAKPQEYADLLAELGRVGYLPETTLLSEARNFVE